jgi:ABC-type transport system involved in multi-copper enzyme maturation permease subunit
MNPIVKKDVRVQARSMRICWEVFAYEAIMALVFFFAMFIIQQNGRYTTGNLYSYIVWLYPALGATQLVILGVVVPIRTATAISGEKERQTFDIMMTTGMTPFSIIAGKVMTAVIQSLFFVVAGLPIMALAFVIGGLAWSCLFRFLAVALLVSVFSASIGIFCSAMCKKSISAIIMSYGIYVIFFLVSALPNVTAQVVVQYYGVSYYVSALPYLLNPAVYLTEFFTWTLAESSVVYRMLNMSFSSTLSTFGAAHVHAVWMAASTVLFIVVSLCFLVIAAKRISPIPKRYARKLAAMGERVSENE